MTYNLSSWSIDDAIAFLIRYLSGETSLNRPPKGYDLAIDSLARNLIGQAHSELAGQSEIDLQEATHVVYDAVWHLVQIGVIRPGMKSLAGNHLVGELGFTLTPYGRKWIESPDRESLILADPTQLTSQFQKFARRLGGSFESRAVEAHHCFLSGAYIACCAMAGAAAEAILLELAIAKLKDQHKALCTYQGRSGRKATRDLLFGKEKMPLQEQVDAYLGLLSYWRDSVAHGAPTTVGVAEARLALIHLLQFAHLASGQWESLTEPSVSAT